MSQPITINYVTTPKYRENQKCHRGQKPGTSDNHIVHNHESLKIHTADIRPVGRPSQALFRLHNHITGT